MRSAVVLAVAASANASPVVEASRMFPSNGWGITDFTLGAITGLYVPIQMHWRNYDCRSNVVALGNDFVKYSKAFDQPANAAVTWEDYISWSARFITTGIQGYYTMGACWSQEADLANVDWSIYYNLKAETPVVSSNIGDMTLEDSILTIIELVLDGWLIYQDAMSEYYYYQWGNLMGYWLATLFTAVDMWGQLNIITPANAWDIYWTQA